MTYVVVETVGDEAAAAVLIEALAAHEIPAQQRRVPGTPYGPAKLELEVRVPAAQLAAARAVLAALAEEAEAAARREARTVEPVAELVGARRRRRPRWWTAERERTLLLLGAAAAAALFLARWFGIVCTHGCPR